MPPADDRREDAAPPPAPRGSSPSKPQRSWRPRPGWIALFLALLAVTFFFSARAMREPARVRVAYSPYFLTQVKEEHVSGITSKGKAVQAEWKQKQSHPRSQQTT